MTEYLRPQHLAEALAQRGDHPEYTVLAGGTDLMVGVREWEHGPGVIDIFSLEELSRIDETEMGLRVGATVTYRRILENALVRQQFPALTAAAREVGALQIQARGTVGGNIGTSSPVGDTLPVLLALDAEVELASPQRTRRIPYASFCTGYRTTALKPDELIVAILLPRPQPGTVQFWRKVGTRRAQSISKVMVACAARVEAGNVSSSRCGFGAMANRPVRVKTVEQLLDGQPPSEALANDAARETTRQLQPIDDVRSTASYRSRVAGRLVAQFVRQLQIEVP